MDWQTFFSTNIKSLAWPIAAIIVLFVLKGELRGVVNTLGNRLRSFKGFGLETTFAEAVDQIEKILPPPEAKEITAAFSGSGRLGGDAAQRIETISELSQLPPPYIVSLAWSNLEQALVDALEYLLDTRRSLSPDTYLRLAMNQGLLSDEEELAIRSLKNIRDRAVHEIGAPISLTDALRYQDIADALIEKIKQRRAAKKPKNE